MAQRTPCGGWRVQWREHRRRKSRVFPPGTAKSVVDKFIAEIRLGHVNKTQEELCPTFAAYSDSGLTTMP
jgi:hypothetical protein